MWYLFLVFDYWEENEFSPWPTCYWGLNLRLLWCCCWIMKICYLCLKYYVVTYEHVMFGSSETITERLWRFCFVAEYKELKKEHTYIFIQGIPQNLGFCLYLIIHNFCDCAFNLQKIIAFFLEKRKENSLPLWIYWIGCDAKFLNV